MSQAVSIHTTPQTLPGTLTAMGWSMPVGLPFEQWQRAGQYLSHLHTLSQWALGDWLNAGQAAYGEKYSQGVELTNYSEKVLCNMAYVAASVEISRRREILSYSHHCEVAKLEPQEQDRWLDEAERDQLSVHALRAELKGAKLEAKLERKRPKGSGRYKLIHCPIEKAHLEIESNSVDCIITDPPYPKEYLPSYDHLLSFASHALKDGGSLVMMVGQSYLPDILAKVSASDMKYQWLLNYMTPGGQAAQMWARNVLTFFKPLIWCVKGEYKGDWIADVCKSDPNDNDKAHHHWGQSESGMADILDRFTDSGDLICDPFLGGGTTGAVAIEQGRHFIGLDIDAGAIETSGARYAGS